MTAFTAQTDSRWASVLLGFNYEQPYNIGNFGCLVTAYANMLLAVTGNSQYDPAWINNWLKANNGFAAIEQPDGSMGVKGSGIMGWAQALGMGGVKSAGTTTNMAQVNAFLAPAPNFAILEVRAGTRQHFVLANKQGQIVDSEDGKVKSINTYPFVQAHLFTATVTPAPTPPPAPSLPSVNGILYNPVPAGTTVKVLVKLNARTAPNLQGQVQASFVPGPAEILGWTVGQSVTVNGRTDDVWLLDLNKRWFAQAGTDANE